MPRPATGRLEPEQQSDGTLRFRLRFRVHGKRESVMLHEQRDCACGCGGGWTERTARLELDNILARVRAGIWERPKAQPVIERTFTEVPSFHEYASYWLQAKREGLIGRKATAESTHCGYRSMLQRHLLPFFGRHRLDEIDRELCSAFRKHKIKEANELRETLAAGADLRDERNRPLRALGPASIRALITCLGQILDEAVEDELIPVNHARGKRLQIHVPKPKRSFLEMDELACLEDAAAEQDPSLERFTLAARTASAGSTASAVALGLSEGKRQVQIAAELGLATGTIHFHVRKLGALRLGVYTGRKALVCTLGRSGVRNSELSDIRIGHLRLHGPEGARFHIPDSKTETGIRDVEVSPHLAETLTDHLERLRKAGRDTGPEAYLFPNERGNRMTRQRVGAIVREATVLATQKMLGRGLPPLAHITPHSLRRTYISIALLANNYDIKWVMDQVGHADSKMTMDVYNQLQQRAKREHGASFDRLMREARTQLYGQERRPAASRGSVDGAWADVWADEAKLTPRTRQPSRPARGQKLGISRVNSGRRSRDSNSQHQSFQSCALPAELSRRGGPMLPAGRFAAVAATAGRQAPRSHASRYGSGSIG